jgi:hypothetical protein
MPPDDPCIMLAMDFGTKLASVAAQHFPDGLGHMVTSLEQMETIMLKERESGKSEIKQVLLFVPSRTRQDDQDLSFGSEVYEKLRQHPELQDSAMEFFKLALDKRFDHRKEVAHVKKVLELDKDRGRLQDLFTDYLEVLVLGVREYYKENSTADKAAYYDNIRIVLQLCVPAI